MAVHISDLLIDTYRGIKNLEIHNLSDINIITGDNNCGKTSIMEVLKNLNNINDINTWLDDIRGGHHKLLPYDVMENLFNIDSDRKELSYGVKKAINKEFLSLRLEAVREVSILSKNELREIASFPNDYNKEVCRFSYRIYCNNLCEKKGMVYNFPTPNIRGGNNSKKLTLVKVKYISPVEHITGDVYLPKVLDSGELYQEMLALLKEFDKNIISINTEKINHSYRNRKVYKVLVKGQKKQLPLDVYGDGMKKAIFLMNAVVIAKDGILLLNEFETAIHPSEMNKVFSWILKTCQRFNIQLFLTSHSKEAIDKLLKCVPEFQNMIRVITLYKKENETVARVLEGREAIESQDDLGLELR